jgi:hypothetical protein
MSQIVERYLVALSLLPARPPSFMPLFIVSACCLFQFPTNKNSPTCVPSVVVSFAKREM